MTGTDKIRNEAIRDELQVLPVLYTIEESQLKWFGHLCKMNTNKSVRKVWKTNDMERDSEAETYNDLG